MRILKKGIVILICMIIALETPMQLLTLINVKAYEVAGPMTLEEMEFMGITPAAAAPILTPAKIEAVNRILQKVKRAAGISTPAITAPAPPPPTMKPIPVQIFLNEMGMVHYNEAGKNMMDFTLKAAGIDPTGMSFFERGMIHYQILQTYVETGYFPGVVTVKNPETEETKTAIRVSPQALESMFSVMRPGMIDFIGPLDLEQANFEWSINNLFKQRVANNNLHRIPEFEEEEIWGFLSTQWSPARPSEPVRWAVFESILDRILAGSRTVNLHGNEYTIYMRYLGTTWGRNYEPRLFVNGESVNPPRVGHPERIIIQRDEEYVANKTSLGWVLINFWSPFPLLSHRIHYAILYRFILGYKYIV